MTEDISLIAITALLPITAGMLISQVNPYHALIIRGILGAVAALVYALLGAADVALTEALVGTMLSITLYAVTVRSSLSMRVGVLEDADAHQPLVKALQEMLDNHHMRLEQVVYSDLSDLEKALTDKEIHTWAISINPTEKNHTGQQNSTTQPAYHLQTRIKRLHEIMQAELSLAQADISWVDLEKPIVAERIPPLTDNRQTLPEGSS